MTATKWIDLECEADGCDETVEFEQTYSDATGQHPTVKEARRLARINYGWSRADNKDFCPQHPVRKQ